MGRPPILYNYRTFYYKELEECWCVNCCLQSVGGDQKSLLGQYGAMKFINDTYLYNDIKYRSDVGIYYNFWIE